MPKPKALWNTTGLNACADQLATCRATCRANSLVGLETKLSKVWRALGVEAARGVSGAAPALDWEPDWGPGGGTLAPSSVASRTAGAAPGVGAEVSTETPSSLSNSWRERRSSARRSGSCSPHTVCTRGQQWRRTQSRAAPVAVTSTRPPLRRRRRRAGAR